MGKYGLKRSERCYDETPDTVRKSEDQKYAVWWDETVVTRTHMEHNRPDVLEIDRVKKRFVMVDFAVSFDRNVEEKEKEKVGNYEPLRREYQGMTGLFGETIPIVVGSLGVVSKNLSRNLARIGVGDVIGGLQTTAIIE